MEKAPTRFAQREQAAEADLAAESQRQEAIEAKLTSPEVAALNDRAELEIWGSGDRTYINPETGDITASPDKPMIGVLDNFAKTRPAPEAKAMAKKYESGLTELLDDGLELCQAKLVMDMRTTDEQDGIPSLTTEFMKNDGLLAQAAEEKAKAIYEKKDAKRLELIKNNGIVNAEEYSQFRNGTVVDATESDDTVERSIPAQPAAPEGDKLGTPEEGEAAKEEQIRQILDLQDKIIEL